MFSGATLIDTLPCSVALSSRDSATPHWGKNQVLTGHPHLKAHEHTGICDGLRPTSVERIHPDHFSIQRSSHPDVLPLPLSMLCTEVALQPSVLPKRVNQERDSTSDCSCSL